MNPKEYCREHQMSTNEFISKVREVAPKYHKSTHCMVCNPAYGVMLRPAVVRHVCGEVEHRTNPCRIQFRCTEAQKTRLTAAMRDLDYPTMQELLAFVVNAFLSEHEKNYIPKEKSA